MRGPGQLHAAEDNWVTDMGAFFPAEGRVVFRGKDLHRDLKGIPWMGLLLHGITGRLFGADQIKLFEGIWTLCTSYPDPRIWNNRVAALAGTTRSTGVLSLAAANAVSEASIYGRRVDIKAIDFLYRTRRRLREGADLEALLRQELREQKVIPGYGRPVAKTDERVAPLMELVGDLGFAGGEFVELAFLIEETLLGGGWRLHMNIAALTAALAADQGLSPEQYYHYAALSFSAGIIACYQDALTKPAGTFFPLRCDRICYSGASQRSWAESPRPPNPADADHTSS